jgi:ribonuclease VapC
VIVIDTSAVVAIFFEEPAAGALLTRMAGETMIMMSVASYVEAGTVIAGHNLDDPSRALSDLDALLGILQVVLMPMDQEQARLALHARLRYGRGMGHGGKLNLGDTFAYALARQHNAPLLFTGRDFDGTDIEPALPTGHR